MLQSKKSRYRDKLHWFQITYKGYKYQYQLSQQSGKYPLNINYEQQTREEITPNHLYLTTKAVNPSQTISKVKHIIS